MANQYSHPQVVASHGPPVTLAFSRWSAVAATVFFAAVTGCASQRRVGPRDTANAFVAAAARNDVDTVYDLLDEKGREALGRDGVARMIRRERKEFGQLGKELKRSRVRQKAIFHAHDGEDFALTFEHGAYRVENASIVTEGSDTPTEAMAKLRSALLRRSYVSLLPLLSKATRAMVEAELRGFAKSLQDPETLNIRVDGSKAIVTLPDGHIVTLEREDDLWWIESVR